jgi:ornithine cyclodeaminase/alanine dehydrogenase-like protein (mu-crystallin family)
MGELKGRTSRDEITLYKSVGIGFSYIKEVVSVYKKAIAAGIRMNIEV